MKYEKVGLKGNDDSTSSPRNWSATRVARANPGSPDTQPKREEEEEKDDDDDEASRRTQQNRQICVFIVISSTSYGIESQQHCPFR